MASSSSSLFLLVLGLFAISAVVSSSLENPAALTQVNEEPPAVVDAVEIPSEQIAAEDEEKQGDDKFLYIFYEGQYCAFTNRNHDRRRCRNVNQCCYCGGLGGQICQSLCQKSDPKNFQSSSCDRCRCTCQYSR